MQQASVNTKMADINKKETTYYKLPEKFTHMFVKLEENLGSKIDGLELELNVKEKKITELQDRLLNNLTGAII